LLNEYKEYTVNDDLVMSDGYGYKRNLCPRPSYTFMIMEDTWIWNIMSWSYASATGADPLWMGHGALRSNLAAVDGHCEKLRYNDTVSPSNRWRR